MFLQSKTLSIVIPAYNEEKRIVGSLNQLFLYLDSEKITAEIIVVDDGSTDQTFKLLCPFKDKIKIISVWPNRGKGYAVKRGVFKASGELILFFDADLATPLSEIGEFIRFSELTSYQYDLLIGSRDLSRITVHRTLFRALIGQIFKLISHLILPLEVKDSQCGFKMMKREVAVEIFKKARIERWAFDLEVLYLAQKKGCRIIEIPVAWTEKSGSRIKLLRDGIRMLSDLFKIRYYGFFEKQEAPLFETVNPHLTVNIGQDVTIPKPENFGKPAYQTVENKKLDNI